MNDKSLHVCGICDKVFSNKFILKRHEQIHSGVKGFTCETCQKKFTQNSHLKRHLMTHNPAEKPTFNCQDCGMSFARSDNLERHFLAHKKEYKEFPCIMCDAGFTRREYLLQHVKLYHSNPLKRKQPSTSDMNKRQKVSFSAFENTFNVYTISPTNPEGDILTFLNDSSVEIGDCLLESIEINKSLKWYLTMQVTLTRTATDGNEEFIYPHFRSKCMIDMVADTVENHIDQAFGKILTSFEEFLQNGSQWELMALRDLEVRTIKYHPLAASSYIPLPSKIAAKKAVLNIQNEDNKCLVWCLLAHKLKIGDHRERVNHYIPHESEIELGNVPCPVPITKIETIERLNNLRINVFGCEDDEVFPLYISKRQDDDVINLLFISNEDRQHYCLILNFSRLLGDLTKHKATSFYCYRCLHRFSSEHLLKNHLAYCTEHSIQRVKMPEEEEKMLSFKNVHFQHPVPYIIYADFEAIITPISTCSQSDSYSFTQKISRHDACGYAFVVVDEKGKTVKPIQVYRGSDAVPHFLNSIIAVKDELAQTLICNKALKMTPEDWIAFRISENCSICSKPLNTDRVKDHDHLTGEYRGAAHRKCNLQFKLTKKIPVVFHNLKKYDAHHIMQRLGKVKDHRLNVIANNMENYISFGLEKNHSGIKITLQFIDSFQFLPSSLEKLVDNLDFDDFKILAENFPRPENQVHLNLLIRKGVYPYSYITDFTKFEEKVLPPPEAFYNDMTEDEISLEDYAHAENVWEKFDIQTLGEYHDLYVKTDVLLLADVFQTFRTLCMSFYSLDCAHLMTSPGLAWQACLKMLIEPLELLTDLDMHLFIERGIRGGVSMISKRMATANNPYLENFDCTKPSSYIMYLDANNLYGWAMSQPLPYGDFKWIDPNDERIKSILSLPENSSQGYILEVDLYYPEELHDLHNDLPVAPEKVTIRKEDLSTYAENALKNNFISTTKLVPNLRDKKNYVIYHRNLQFYLSLGLKLTKVHKIIEFSQKPWLETYINFNTENRKHAKSPNQKDLFKLMNNSVYGKTMESVRSHIDIQLVNTKKKAKKLVAAPTFKSFKIFDEDLVGIERVKSTILLNKPIYAGFVILELSKLLMFDFHYNFIKKQYGEKASLLFTDTDSLTYHIETPDFYDDMLKSVELFDTSDYPRDHACFSEVNKKKVGCFKDELNSKPVAEFVGLRAKMYSILSGDNSEKKTLKGHSRHMVKKNVKHEHYKECLLNNSYTRLRQMRFVNEKHEIFTTTINKVALSSFDDKRFLLEDGISSYAYGHYKIRQEAE